MKLSSPKLITRWVAVIVAVVGVVLFVLAQTSVLAYDWVTYLGFALEFLAAALLAVATVVPGV